MLNGLLCVVNPNLHQQKKLSRAFGSHIQNMVIYAVDSLRLEDTPIHATKDSDQRNSGAT